MEFDENLTSAVRQRAVNDEVRLFSSTHTPPPPPTSDFANDSINKRRIPELLSYFYPPPSRHLTCSVRDFDQPLSSSDENIIKRAVVKPVEATVLTKLTFTLIRLQSKAA